jgi:hypothetical protein
LHNHLAAAATAAERVPRSPVSTPRYIFTTFNQAAA